MINSKKKKSASKKSRDSIKSLKEKKLILEKELEINDKEIQRIKEKSVRLLAEFDNYKRRTQEERSDLLQYGGKDLAKAILPVLDDLNRTVESNSESNSTTILEGVKLILSNLKKIFKEQGITSFDSIGKEFDPDQHEALMSEKSTKKDNIILKEFEKGYMYNKKILRHAKVVVSKR